MEINIGKLYKYERRQIADNLFVASVFVAFLGSMNVWFMVPLHTYFPILAFLLALASYLILHIMPSNIYGILLFAANNGLYSA